MEKLTINIAKDFTDCPGARYYNDGDFSGEEFRKEFLEKNFNDYDLLEINLDGTEGYATSFLEEAFGGLARKYTSDEVLSKVQFISFEEPNLIDEIKSYIEKVEK